METEWYDDRPMFRNEFERLVAMLEQMGPTWDHYAEEKWKLLENREELEAIVLS